MNICSICFDEINNTVTDCNHSFCKGCIDTWFKKGKKECPICRRVISEIIIDSEKTRIYFYKEPNNSVIQTNNNNIDYYRNYKYYKTINYILWLLIIYELYENIVKSYQISGMALELTVCSKNLTTYMDEYTDCFDKTSDLTMFYLYYNHQLKGCYAPVYYINKCLGNI